MGVRWKRRRRAARPARGKRSPDLAPAEKRTVVREAPLRGALDRRRRRRHHHLAAGRDAFCGGAREPAAVGRAEAARRGGTHKRLARCAVPHASTARATHRRPCARRAPAPLYSVAARAPPPAHSPRRRPPWQRVSAGVNERPLARSENGATRRRRNTHAIHARWNRMTNATLAEADGDVAARGKASGMLHTARMHANMAKRIR